MKQNDMTKPFDVIVIGGGATGAGIARDCARRGIRVLLIERFDISTGATGRNHGLLHSGARYAVTDQESAEECIKENRILRRIASHCVEETDGLFLSLPEETFNIRQNLSMLVDVPESGPILSIRKKRCCWSHLPIRLLSGR